ncbi:MAG: bifunctional hydroxymethylpyrimidine kinase/phosphomethylpyrimidine kinase, partial [Alicyclobacillus sp.]|nr:bifunctional hydroxymethylpyrimidine kinase/phosphomethylpyrimidine kinase [Alicyclobacillus sp.]
QDLLPRDPVVNPNLPEAEVLCGFHVDSWSACHRAAERLCHMGPAWVVVKGGHAQRSWLQAAPWPQLQASEHAVDIVFDGEQFTYLAAPRVPSRKTHGTGCTFSAAVAAALACGSAPLTALAQAKGFIYQAVAAAAAWDVGNGHGPTDHSVQPPAAVELAPGGAYLWVDGGWQAL